MTVRNHAPWSVSKAAVAHDCTLRFNLKYVAKRAGKRSVGTAAKVGSAVHLFLEYRLQGIDVETAYVQTLRQEKLTRPEQRKLQEFVQPAARFLDRFRAFLDKRSVPEDATSIEFGVAFTRDRVLVDYWDKSAYWRGKWDIGVYIPDGARPRAIIMDHKTGNPLHKKPERYETQLKSYLVSALIAQPELRTAQTVIHWVREDDASKLFDWGKPKTRSAIEAELVPWFFEYYDAAQKRTEEPPMPTAGDYCRFCEYTKVCPLKA